MRGWLCGPTYQSYSQTAAAERCVNLFPQRNGKTWKLLAVPGKRAFATAPDSGGRAHLAQDGRDYAVIGGTFCEVHPDGTVTARGTVANDGKPASMASNGARGHQIAIASGGLLYGFTITTNAFVQVTDPQLSTNIIGVGYIDGYFIVWTPDRFGLSASLDVINWGADIGQRLGASEGIVGGIVDHEVLWLPGGLRTEVWFNSGAASFPFEPIPGVFLEHGLAASHAVAAFGDSIAWLMEDARGGRTVVRNQGYNAVQISTPAIAAMLTACTTVRDAMAWTYQILGHTFFVLSIPSQHLTLQYDAKDEQWSELGLWRNGEWEADRAVWLTYAFGKHLALDRETGTIWEVSMDIYADGDQPKVWLRRAPEIAEENKTIFHHWLKLDADLGVGLSTGQGSDPLVMLRYSDNRETWSEEQTASLGAMGEYTIMPQWDMLGSSRGRVYEFSGSAPVRTVLNDAYLEVSVGTH
jgi:hypothetical protein